jgi:hypothetical protein
MYYLEEFFGIDVQIKVMDLDFWILFVQLGSPMLLSIFIRKFET